MNASTLTRRAVLQALAASVFVVDAMAQEKKPSAPVGSDDTEVVRRDKDERIRELEEYYAKLYAQPLQSPERLPKEVAVVSLSRIDAPATTAALFGVLKGQTKEPVVTYLAWEALHARRASLSFQQQREWTLDGARAAGAGAFPGWTVAPVLRALAGQPPSTFDPAHAKLALRVVQENDPENPGGLDALSALRDWVAAWREPALVKALVSAMNKPSLSPRIDHALRGLPSPPESEKESRKLAGAWNAWMKSANLARAADADVKPYTGKSAVFGAPERITSPSDSRWRKELEIGKCTVTDFDLVWCIDSTGSMNAPNQMVAKETGALVRVAALVSRRARCGAVYYRHETEPALMQQCCQRVAGNPKFYRTKTYKLTTDASGLAATMAAERIPEPDPRNEGNVHPGSPYHGALKTAIAEQPWTREKLARRVIIIVGDSFLTPGSERAATELTAEAAKHGYDVHALCGGQAARTWPDVVKAGGGQLITIGPGGGGAGPRRPVRRPDSRPAGDTVVSDFFRSLLIAALTPAVAPDYRDRIDPLLEALVPFARASEAAENANPSTSRR